MRWTKISHPGSVLLLEYMLPRGLTQTALAEHLGVTIQRINEIIAGKRNVTPSTAWLLAGALGTTPRLWMDLQSNYDLERHKPARKIRRWRR
jgi:addiction module HigA family antidote